MRGDAVYRALEREIAAAADRGSRPVRVLDVGGGSGVWAVPLAASGCAVTVVDPSPDALAVLRRRATEAGCAARVTALQGDTDVLADVVAPGAADLVLAHGVLEVVDDLDAAVGALAVATAPGGVLSVLVANRFAAVLTRAMAGRVAEARALLADPEGRSTAGGGADGLRRRLDSVRLDALLGAAGLRVELLQGHGVVADLVPGAVLDANPGAAEALAELELVAAVTPPLRDIATRLHALARRPSGIADLG
ncbi:MAG TPA: class I SAM-dependent methyltransferase [Pseudonocardiaceae bacterium]